MLCLGLRFDAEIYGSKVTKITPEKRAESKSSRAPAHQAKAKSKKRSKKPPSRPPSNTGNRRSMKTNYQSQAYVRDFVASWLKTPMQVKV